MNQSNDGSPLLNLLLMAAALGWLLRRMGFFHGITTGFWSGFFTRLFVGTLRSPSGSGLLEWVLKIIVYCVIGLIVLGWLAGR